MIGDSKKRNSLKGALNKIKTKVNKPSMIIETSKVIANRTPEEDAIPEKRKLSKINVPISKAGISFDETEKGTWICNIRNAQSNMYLEIELPEEEKEILRTGKNLTLEFKIKGK